MSSFPVQSSGNLADKSLALGSSTTISDIDLTASFHEELRNLRSKLEQRDKDISELQDLFLKMMQCQEVVFEAHRTIESLRSQHASNLQQFAAICQRRTTPMPRGNGLDIKCCERHSKHSSKKWSTTSDGSEWHQDPWRWNWWYNSQVVDGNGVECREPESVIALPSTPWTRDHWDRWKELAQKHKNPARKLYKL